MLEMKVVRIPDRWGAEHEYRIEAHPHAQGAAIATTLLKIVGPTVAKALFAALQDWGADVQEATQVAVEASEDVSGGLVDAAQAALQKAAAEERAREQLQQFLTALDEKLDIEATLARVFEGIVTAGGLQKLAPALFEFTFRDGVALKMPTALDCYTANYREELLALWEVVQHNGFLELLSFSAAAVASPRKAS